MLWPLGELIVPLEQGTRLVEEVLKLVRRGDTTRHTMIDLISLRMI